MESLKQALTLGGVAGLKMRMPGFTAELATRLESEPAYAGRTEGQDPRNRVIPQFREEWGMDCSSGECVGYHCWEGADASYCEYF